VRGCFRNNGKSWIRGESPSPDRFAIDLSPQAGRGEETAFTKNPTYTRGMLTGLTSRDCAASLIPAFAAPNP
jgi:hypothetical protein